MRTLVFFIMTCIVLSSGCAGKVTKTTDKGLFHIKLSSKGELLKFGRNEVDLYVTDEKGAGVEGAKIEITPWMPEHGHGALWPPAVTERGRGLYRVVIPLTMIGHWELRIRVHKGDTQDSTAFDFPNVAK